MGSPLNAPAGDDSQFPNDDDDAVALLDLVYATGTAEFGVDLARVLGNSHAPHGLCAVWPIMGSDNRPRGLLIQVGAPNSSVPTQHEGSSSIDQLHLQEVNGRLLIAGLLAQEQAAVQVALRDEADAALAALNEFISIAAHELRTPVTGIKLGTDLALRTLEDATPDTQRVVRYLRNAVGGANRLVLLLNELMDVSRMQNGKLLLRVIPVDLVSLVSSVVRRYTSAGNEEHHMTTDLPAAPLMVAGDAVRLEQIVENLLGNAVKYSPDGGKIGISLREALEGIVLSVSDAGIGLTPDWQERIFEPFGRADNARRLGLPGMGLGLHICRQIAAAHGGRMWAESGGETRGMTVAMWLPAA
ncbi:MAG: HAMP domain-containing histidine kinase [Chloroflexota bacterium]|nr:HAMP domain-containing histidine kinase [Chloroflexota bacterium]